MNLTARRKALSNLVVFLCGASVALALVPLILIFFYVIKQGFSSLNWDFFTKMPKPVGEAGGGLANSIVGSLIITALGSLFAIPIGVVAGLFAADTLNGVPSIVIGVFVYGLVVLPMRQFSALAGGVALGVMMIPIIARTT